MAAADPVVVGAIVDGAQTLAEGLAVRAIGNASPVSFRRKVFRVRQVFLAPPVERAHRVHRVSQASRVIRTLLGLPTRPTPPVHPVHHVHPVRRAPLGLPVLRGSRDFLGMMVPLWPPSRPHRRLRSRFEPSAAVCPRRRLNSGLPVPQGGMDVILRTSAPLWDGVVSQRCQSTLTQRLGSRRTRSNGLDNGPFFFLFGFP